MYRFVVRPCGVRECDRASLAWTDTPVRAHTTTIGAIVAGNGPGQQSCAHGRHSRKGRLCLGQQGHLLRVACTADSIPCQRKPCTTDAQFTNVSAADSSPLRGFHHICARDNGGDTEYGSIASGAEDRLQTTSVYRRVERLCAPAHSLSSSRKPRRASFQAPCVSSTTHATVGSILAIRGGIAALCAFPCLLECLSTKASRTR